MKCFHCSKDVDFYAVKIKKICKNCYYKEQRKNNRKNNYYIRNCPICNKEIIYSTKYALINANNNKHLCKICKQQEKNNSFYKKHHTQESKEKISTNHKGKKHTNKTKKLMSFQRKGSKNAMYGKSVYKNWINKYGQQIANCKYIDMLQKISNANKGKNNSMYGKPPPQGSGSGWSGWYKGYFLEVF